jgi:hypothetical protein
VIRTHFDPSTPFDIVGQETSMQSCTSALRSIRSLLTRLARVTVRMNVNSPRVTGDDACSRTHGPIRADGRAHGESMDHGEAADRLREGKARVKERDPALGGFKLREARGLDR